MEAGRQFDNTTTLPLAETYRHTCRQSTCVAQFGIGYLGINIG